MNFLNMSKLNVLLFLCSLFLLGSCASPEKLRYFNGVEEGRYSKSIDLDIMFPTLQKGDILSITVKSLNQEASAMFNPPVNMYSAFTTNTTVDPYGYLVSPKGTIEFPILGEINADGVRKDSLAAYIRKELVDRKLLIDPIVTIRIMNFRVTVLGEVNRPGVINILNEKITVLEALGLAGDMTLYGKRHNIMLIRDEGPKRLIKRLDISSDQLFKSEYYYLKSGDVIYVETNNTKVQSTSRFTQLLPAILSGLAFLAIIFDRYTR
jgi:polysaccharide export outer membrane protein